MKRTLIKMIAFLKGLILLVRPHLFLGWLRSPMATAANTLRLTQWIAKQDKQVILNDFYTGRRDYSKRYQLYQSVVDELRLKNEPVDYLEFGVSGGYSFNWWLSACTNADSAFYGFDTFEGLPEQWGTYDKGDMSATIPVVEDARAEFIKGLFQDTLHNFLLSHNLKNDRRKIVHLDADLFSSTLFTLTTLAPYLKKGDILFFDEFNVPNHEFLAFIVFSESFYIKTKFLGAVNNFYQTALIIE